MQISVNNIEKIKNLYDNINYIITGYENGWLDMHKKKDQKIIELCYILKTLSEHSYNELFKFKDKGLKINLK